MSRHGMTQPYLRFTGRIRSKDDEAIPPSRPYTRAAISVGSPDGPRLLACLTNTAIASIKSYDQTYNHRVRV